MMPKTKKRKMVLKTERLLQGKVGAVQEFLRQVRVDGLRGHSLEHRFSSPRRWRFDIAWVDRKIAVEIDGGVYARYGARRCPLCRQIPSGRHTSGAGFEKDCEKMDEAVLLGWRVFRFTPKMIESGYAIDTVARVLR